MSDITAQQSPKEDRYPLTPAPTRPFELNIQNLALEVPENETIAGGWTPWSATDEDYRPPDLFAAVVDGRRLQGIRAEYRYDFCLLQQVKALPGYSVTFTMDFRVEPSAAHQERARPEGIVVGVGLDPLGGTNPRDDSVCWALRDLKYSQAVTASVTATAIGELVTVFVRSLAFIPGSNTVATNGTGGLCAETCVRTLYARTYLLLPPGTPRPVWERAARHASVRGWTVGGSADDAGLGANFLEPKPVVSALNPQAWANPAEPQGLTANWFDVNYPGVQFQTLSEVQMDP